MTEPQYRLEGIVHTRSEEREDFEGPLDVIFLLLSKNKIEIQDVSITAILEQYLAYLEEMKRLDMEIASEFITMASHLMLIKTKMLLSAAEAAEAENELDLLRQSLIERRRKEAMEGIRTAITELEPRNEIGRCIFTKQKSRSFFIRGEVICAVCDIMCPPDIKFLLSKYVFST